MTYAAITEPMDEAEHARFDGQILGDAVVAAGRNTNVAGLMGAMMMPVDG